MTTFKNRNSYLFALCVVTLVIGLGAGCVEDVDVDAESADGMKIIDGFDEYGDPSSEDSIGRSVNKLSGTSKVCSIYYAGSWRSNLIVPNGWTWHDCHSLRQTQGATHFELGCVTETGYVFGKSNSTYGPTTCW